jgi:hypothetical protein
MTLLRSFLSSHVNLVEEFYKVIDDYSVYTFFIGEELDMGEKILSPIRSTDDFPSFCLFVPNRVKDVRANAIFFKDLGDGNSGNVFKFVKEYASFYENIKLITIKDVIAFIDARMKLGLGSKEKVVYTNLKREFKPKEIERIYFKKRNFTQYDLKYWAEFGVSEEDLNFFEVKSIKYWLTREGLIIKEFKHTDIAFIYQFYDREKLYQPLSGKSQKFRNSCPSDNYVYYQGFKYLRGKKQGVKILIVTKSYKDVIVLYKYFNEHLNILVDVISPPAESILLSDDFITYANENYDVKLCVSDFDNAGVKFANYCKKKGFIYKFVDTKRVNISGKLRVLDKDISDFRKNHGHVATKLLLKTWKLQKYYLT